MWEQAVSFIVLLWIDLDDEPTQSSEQQMRSFHKNDRKLTEWSERARNIAKQTL